MNNSDQSLQEYKQLLKTHDWFYTWADDQHLLDKGRETFVKLIDLQEKHDPDYTLWNIYAPQQYKRAKKLKLSEQLEKVGA